MAETSKTKYVSDIEIDESDVKVQKPFKISQEERRRFIRLEISAPISMKNLKENFESKSPLDDAYDIKGEILNISSCGLLADLDSPLSEDDIVFMKFTLQDTATLDNVLGLVKRVDHDDYFYITGIELISVEKLQDRLSAAEFDLVSGKARSFEDSVKQTLDEYLYHEK